MRGLYPAGTRTYRRAPDLDSIRGGDVDPVMTLERWCESGAGYRVLHLSDERAVVELLSCLGEPEERIESGDPRLIDGSAASHAS